MLDVRWYIALWFVPLIALFLLARVSQTSKKIYIILSNVVMLFYLIWRIVFTMPPANSWVFVFPLFLIISEALGIIASVIFSFMMFKKAPTAPPLPEQTTPNYLPKVDILISTYNEPMKLVMATALAAKALPYTNKRVHICDDGHRKELKELAHEHEIHYISRKNSHNAKAGNINHALSVTDGELVLLLDADFIVKPGLLLEGVPYFQDDNIALVQFPQSFYNKDPYQLVNPKLYNDQDFFMRFEEPQLARHNALIHIGTNAIFRRSALHAIGGIPTSSITEDMATGMLLQNAGFKTVYINKAYALGVSPYNLRDFKKQRQRWARGNMQVFDSIKPLRQKGLNWIQKVLYVDMFWYWFTSFQKIIYIISPALFLIFGINMIELSVEQIVTILIPYLLVLALNLNILVGRERSFWGSHLYDTLVAPFHASAVLKELFHAEKVFQVTPKETKTSSGKFDFKTVIPHIVLLIMQIVALVSGFLQFDNQVVSVAGYIVCFIWTIYNIAGLAFAISTAKSMPIQTVAGALSVSIDENVQYKDYRFNAFEMSFDGVLAKAIGKKPELTSGKIYHLTVERTGLVVSVLFDKETDGVFEFQFKSLDQKAATRLAAYYAEQLHAAKVLDFDREISAE